MLVPAFVVSSVLTLSSPAPGASRAAPAATAPDRPRDQAEPSPSPVPEADRLYALRARRRFAAYLRMRLLELREQGLERAADAIERGLPVDTLLER